MLAENEDDITLLFTDVDMPGRIDGFELAQETARRWPDIAIVVASGRRKPGQHDLPDGSTFVGKPFSAEVVHHHLHKVLPEDRKPEPLRQAAEQARIGPRLSGGRGAAASAGFGRLRGWRSG